MLLVNYLKHNKEKNLNLIRLKVKQKIFYYQLLKIVERLLSKGIEKQMKHWNSNLANKEECFNLFSLISIEESWMLGLTSLEVYNFIFDITQENNKLELYIFPDSKIGGISYEAVRDDIEKTWKLQILQLPTYKKKY